MSLPKDFIVTSQDKKGDWVYEGVIDNMPIFTPKQSGEPKRMTYNECQEVCDKHRRGNTIYLIERA